MSRVLTLKDYYSLINLQPKSFKSTDKKINYGKISKEKNRLIELSLVGGLSFTQWFLLYEVRHWQWAPYTLAQIEGNVKTGSIESMEVAMQFCKIDTETIFCA